MIFQILDDKRDCLGLFSNGEFYYGHIKRAFEKTWDWSPHLSDDDYEYAAAEADGEAQEARRGERLAPRRRRVRRRPPRKAGRGGVSQAGGRRVDGRVRRGGAGGGGGGAGGGDGGADGGRAGAGDGAGARARASFFGPERQ